jgi:WhiB family redox-sensing transcriptional regulator
MTEPPLPDLPGGLHQPAIPSDESGRIVWMLGDFDDRAWRLSAACRESDATVFFPVGATGPAIQQIEGAKVICHRCPVRLACLQFALVSNQEYGVWGGHDEDERREMRRQWRRLGRPLRIVQGAVSPRPTEWDDVRQADQPPEAS